VFIVAVYFVIDSVRKLLDIPSYDWWGWGHFLNETKASDPGGTAVTKDIKLLASTPSTPLPQKLKKNHLTMDSTIRNNVHKNITAHVLCHVKSWKVSPLVRLLLLVIKMLSSKPNKADNKICSHCSPEFFGLAG
jgi:hypothetical protein